MFLWFIHVYSELQVNNCLYLRADLPIKLFLPWAYGQFPGGDSHWYSTCYIFNPCPIIITRGMECLDGPGMVGMLAPGQDWSQSDLKLPGSRYTLEIATHTEISTHLCPSENTDNKDMRVLWKDCHNSASRNYSYWHITVTSTSASLTSLCWHLWNRFWFREGSGSSHEKAYTNT